MRQAGRYHKHYQGLRAKHSFEELCKIPELASEVAMGPIMDFDFDVAILFSDILFPLEGLGMGLEYTDKGPSFSFSVQEDNLHHLKSVQEAVQFLDFQKKAIEATRERLPKDKSLIGFVGGIWTLFTYAVEGKHAGNLIQAKRSISLRQKLFPILEELILKNIELQIAGGAELVMIFDTAAGELSHEDFHSIIVPSIRKIADKYPSQIGYYAKNITETMYNEILRITNLCGTGVDHRFSIASLLKRADRGFVQGNFDQVKLFYERSDLEKALMDYLKPILKLSPDERVGWICGLGHGVLPLTPESNVKYVVDKIREAFK